MSLENADAVRRVFELWNDQGFEAAAAQFEQRTAPEFEFVARMGGEIEGTVYRGPKGVAAWHRDMLEAFDEVRPEADQFIDLGNYVLVIGRSFMRGRQSGVGGDFPWAQLFEFRGDTLVSCWTYADAQTALEGIAPNLARVTPTIKDGRLDRNALLQMLDEAVVWDVSRSSFPDAGVYQGIDGVRAWLAGLEDAFEGIRYEGVAAREQGNRVVALTRIHGRGASTKIDVEYSFAQAWTFRDGKVIRMDRYDTWEEALSAAGLVS